eukprot:TRINITY_DN8494_c0_g5_i1.p1 TRINITY_DN8494_c0_g5~~TRINITY_DN8494_c0_g5_i1.p1  ORF type:complete len:253 (-),score=5.95 TRINITY_DN8494_c0_g5_i1:402-1160(-)
MLDPLSRERRKADSTFGWSLRALQQTGNTLAIDLLRCCSYYSSSGIPRDVLREVVALRRSQQPKRRDEDSGSLLDDLQDVVRQLERRPEDSGSLYPDVLRNGLARVLRKGVSLWNSLEPDDINRPPPLKYPDVMLNGLTRVLRKGVALWNFLLEPDRPPQLDGLLEDALSVCSGLALLDSNGQISVHRLVQASVRHEASPGDFQLAATALVRAAERVGADDVLLDAHGNGLLPPLQPPVRTSIRPTYSCRRE